MFVVEEANIIMVSVVSTNIHLLETSILQVLMLDKQSVNNQWHL